LYDSLAQWRSALFRRTGIGVDNPDSVTVQAVSYAAVAAPALLVAGLLWIWRRPRLLPLPQLRSGTWSGRDVFLAYLVMNLMPVVISAFLRGNGPLPDGDTQEDAVRRLLWLGPAILPATLTANFFLMWWIASTRPADLGFSLVRILPNVVLGILGFALVTPVLLGLYLALLRVWNTDPHFLEKIAMEQALSTFEWGLLWFQVAVFAPIIEEWFFRGVLQGWLRRASPLGHAVVLISTFLVGSVPIMNHLGKDRTKEAAAEEKAKSANEMEAGLAALTFAAVLGCVYGVGAVRRWQPLIREGLDWFLPLEAKSKHDAEAESRAAESEHDEDVPDEDVEALDDARMEEIIRQPKWRAWQESLANLSVFGSAMLFAMFHMSWPSPIPIFLLGLVLGWLRLRTQNLWPGIVLHSLFNQVAFLALLWSAMHQSS
jgi:membrane protease YdiL (CAAX protease family)